MGNFGSDRWVLEPNGSTLRHGLIQRGDGHRYRRSPGIGRAVAEQIGEAGANVVLADAQGEKVSDVADGLAGQGMNPNGVKCDITDPTQTDALAAHAQERFGSVDMLVNNAGNFTQGPFTELDHDSWHRVVGVNLTGTFNFSRSVVPGMVETGGGRVVNVSSMAGRNVSFNGAANDTASKWGVIGLTKHMARELAPRSSGERSASRGDAYAVSPFGFYTWGARGGR